MGRTEQADNFRIDFINSLRAQGAKVEDMASFARIFDDRKLQLIFQRWDSLGRELFYVNKVGFVNVHVRSDPPGFWGITKRIIEDFDSIKNELKISCWFVLLVGKEDGTDVNGYILEIVFSTPVINSPSEQAEAYKINERDLDSSKVVKSSAKVAEELIEVGRRRFPGSTSTVIRRPKL